jgi:magnesium-transporting ATPase (P-type)
MDVICVDKTGTITENHLSVEAGQTPPLRHPNSSGCSTPPGPAI